jgi:hypothetical protein
MMKKIRNTSASGSACSHAGSAREKRGVLTETAFASASAAFS